MITIGFAGTAKNTGKTTAALKVLTLSRSLGLKTALTSIGYDGESLDNVTGLPKPRYVGQPGILVATAQDCLKVSAAHYRILEHTPIQTILGPVVIAEILHPGTILLAGPNRRPDLTHLFHLLARYFVDLTLVDGALNRLVPLICTDGLVLSTGAAFDPDINRIADHIQALTTLFSISKTTFTPSNPGCISLHFKDQTSHPIHSSSLLSFQTLQQCIAAANRPVQSLVLPGACSPALLEDLWNKTHDNLHGAEIVFGNPLNLIASANPVDWLPLFQSILKGNGALSYLENIPLRLITVNPFYPRFTATGVYIPASIDKTSLLRTVQGKADGIPVVNIEDSPLIHLTKELEHLYARPIY